jgi:tyrosinase
MPILSKVTTPEISADHLPAEFTRADIQFNGLDHSGSSYEGRVFVNNPQATAATEATPENGYAGSYYIFGHGGCYGDQGHCDVRVREPYDPRPPHGLSPARKVVIASEAIRAAVGSGAKLTVTVVPLLLSTTEKVPENEAIPSFQSVSVIAYQ